MSQKKPNEIDVWTVAVGNLPNIIQALDPNTRKAVDFICKLEGFLGFHPVPPHGTLCIFKSKNLAIRAKNLMNAEDIQTGFNIGHCFIDKKYLREGDKDVSTRIDSES